MVQVQETSKIPGLDRLRQLRDELRVQAALAQVETRQRWELMEDRWDELEDRLARLGDASEDVAEDVKDAVGELIDEIGDGYERIREAFGRETPRVPGLERVARLRDELRLKLALGKAEVKGEWERLEESWENLRRRLRSVEGASAETASEVRKAARKVVDEIGDGYDRIRRTL